MRNRRARRGACTPDDDASPHPIADEWEDPRPYFRRPIVSGGMTDDELRRMDADRAFWRSMVHAVAGAVLIGWLFRR